MAIAPIQRSPRYRFAGRADLPPSNCYVLLYEYDGPEALSVDGFDFTILGCLNVPPYDNEPRTLNVGPGSAGNATMSLGSRVKGRSEANRSLKPKRAT